MLIAEEFVLLALEPDGTAARGALNQENVAVGVTGALVTELVQDGHVDLTGGVIRLTGSKPEQPLLAQALDNLAPHDAKLLKSRLNAVKHAGWNEVVDAMVERGALGRDKQALRPTRHPVADPEAHTALLTRVRDAATGSGPLDPRIATLLALAGPCQMLEVVAPERSDRAAAKRRIAEATKQVPAAAGVKFVIQAMQAAAAAGAVVAAAAGSSG